MDAFLIRFGCSRKTCARSQIDRRYDHRTHDPRSPIADPKREIGTDSQKNFCIRERKNLLFSRMFGKQLVRRADKSTVGAFEGGLIWGNVQRNARVHVWNNPLQSIPLFRGNQWCRDVSVVDALECV